MSAEHDLQQLRGALWHTSTRILGTALHPEDCPGCVGLATLSCVGERIDAQQAEITRLESLVARSANTAETRGEGICDRCLHDYVVWYTPNDVWNRVVRANGGGGYGDDPGRDVFLCPACFTKLGAERGIADMWMVAPDNRDWPNLNLAEQITVVRNDDPEGRRFAPLHGGEQP